MPRRKRLTDAGIARLRPKEREYTVRDTGVAGLGVRVRPSGSRTFIYHRKTADGVRKMSFGPAALRKVEDVRRDCLAAASGATDADDTSREAPPLFRDFVAGPWKAACHDRCKPSTQRNYGGVLKTPAASGLRVPAPRPHHPQHDAQLVRDLQQDRAGGGQRSAEPAQADPQPCRVLRPYRGQPGKRGIRRNPGRKLTRFLSREEIARLHRILDGYAHGSRSHAQQADIIRLLLLTGCRKNEIVRLRRDEAKGDRLELRDSKTGPRTVLLNARAQEIVERRMAQGNGPWVFPSVRDPSRPQDTNVPLWYRVRREAGIEDVRLHDLRHTVASQAVLNGVVLARHRSPARAQRRAHDHALRPRRRP